MYSSLTLSILDQSFTSVYFSVLQVTSTEHGTCFMETAQSPIRILLGLWAKFSDYRDVAWTSVSYALLSWFLVCNNWLVVGKGDNNTGGLS